MALPNAFTSPRQAYKRSLRLSPQIVHGSLCVLLTALVFLPMLLSFEEYDLTRTNFVSIASFLAIGGVALGNLFYASYRRPFSINIAHWTFLLMFFFIAPFVQYLTGHIPGQADPAYTIGPGDIMGQYHLKANLCILGWCFAYMAVYYRLTPRMGGPEEQPGRRPDLANVAVLGGFALLVLGFIIAYFGTSQFFRTRGDTSAAEGLASTGSVGLNLIVGTAVASMPIFIFFLLLSIKRRSAAYFPVLMLVGTIVLLLNNPISSARFAFGTSALSILSIFLAKKRLSALWIPLSLLFGFFTLFPLLNIARSKTLAEGAAGFKLNTYAAQLSGGDFDAYTVMLDTMNYVDAGPGPRGGLGISSAVLYLVPRDVWFGRSKGSGIDLGEYYQFVLKNLSCPLPAEGYFDFGIIGVFGYAMLFATYCGLLDRWYWRRPGTELPPLTFAIIYPTLIGGTIILLRGSLHPILAFSSTAIPAALTVVLVSKIGVRHRRRPTALP